MERQQDLSYMSNKNCCWISSHLTERWKGQKDLYHMCPTKIVAEFALTLRMERPKRPIICVQQKLLLNLLSPYGTMERQKDLYVSNKNCCWICSHLTERWKCKKTYHMCSTKNVAEFVPTLTSEGRYWIAKRSYRYFRKMFEKKWLPRTLKCGKPSKRGLRILDNWDPRPKMNRASASDC